jgi:uncharacterized protein (TIGR00369 family)
MDIQQKIKNFLENANGEQIEVLNQLIDGVGQKEKKKCDYISSVLRLERKFDDEGNYIVDMPVTEFNKNKIGAVHGGLLATLADSAMGYMIYHQTGSFPITTDLQIRYLNPGSGNKLTAKTSILKKGRKIISTECKMYDEEEILVASASANFYLK